MIYPFLAINASPHNINFIEPFIFYHLTILF
jgi:hypothetical protein